MATAIVSLPAKNGRIPVPPEPETFRPPGFRFVRWFLLLILITMGATTGLVGFLSWHLGMDVTIEATGTVEPRTRQYVKSELGGLIKRIHVRQGQHIQTGDPIAELDDAEWHRNRNQLDRDIAIINSRIDEIKIQMEQERHMLDAERLRAMQERQTAALHLEQIRREYALHYKHHALDDLLPVRLRQTALHRADAEIERIDKRIDAIASRQREIQTLIRQREKLESDRAYLDRQLVRTTLHAPISGIVLTGDLQHRTGDRIQPGDPLLELAKPDDWQVRLHVSEIDIAKIQIGQLVRLYVHAFPHMEYRVFDGTITEYAPKPAFSGTETSGVYSVYASIADPYISDGERSYTLHYGQSVEAKIVIERGRIIDLIWKKIMKTAGRATRHDFYAIQPDMAP